MTATASLPQLYSFRLPSSRLMLWELPFWFTLVYGSLVPATQVVQREWFGIPMWYSDLSTILSGFFYGCALFGQMVLRRRLSVPVWPIIATIAMVLLGAFTLWSGPAAIEDKLGMSFTLLMAVAAPVQAAGVMSSYSEAETKEFLDRLVLFLAAICLIYTAESVFNLGLRSDEGRNLGLDFGIQRVRGPLFGPSTGYLLLLPAIGWSMRAFFDKRKKLFTACLTAGSLLAALLGLGSRAALILLGCYMLVLALMMKQLRRKVLATALLAFMSAGAAALIYGSADTQRLQKFEDNYRTATYETAWRILESEGVISSLAGQGYGAIWNWYRRDILYGDKIAIGDNIIATGYGVSLYHSHSTLLELIVEFGLPGVIWLLLLSTALLKLPRISPDTSWRAYSWAVVISVLAFGFDLFLFKSVRVSGVWWIFVFGALALARAQHSVRRSAA